MVIGLRLHKPLLASIWLKRVEKSGKSCLQRSALGSIPTRRQPQLSGFDADATIRKEQVQPRCTVTKHVKLAIELRLEELLV